MLEWDILSVYPYKEENIQEILCRIYSIVEELKKNGQVVEPGSIEKLKADVEQLKQQMGTEFDQKIKEALDKLNETILIESKTDLYPANIIKDAYINDYTQVLTAGKYTNHQNVLTYGKCKLHVKNGVGTVTGLLKIEDNFREGSGAIQMIENNVDMKQTQGTYFTSTGYSLLHEQFSGSLSLPLVLNANGGISIDRYFVTNQGANFRNYISMACSFPIVKSYVRDKDKDIIDEKISQISYVMNENTSSIVLSCDAHIRPTAKDNEVGGVIDSNPHLYIPKYLNYLNTRLGSFATICNGDTLTESAKGQDVETQEQFLRMMDVTRKMFVDNTLFVMGNHDDQSLGKHSGGYISNQDFMRYMNKGKTGINPAPNNNVYYSADDTKGRCRHIIMNSHDGDGEKIGLFQFGKEQILWMIEQLKTTPANNSIVLYSHISPMISPDMHRTPEEDRMINGKQIHSILKSFVSRTKGNVTLQNGDNIDFDFTGCNGLIAGFVSGHDHIDKFEKIDGINYIIEQATNGQEQEQEPKIKPVYSIILVDNVNKFIRLFRSGNRPNQAYGFGGKVICQ